MSSKKADNAGNGTVAKNIPQYDSSSIEDTIHLSDDFFVHRVLVNDLFYSAIIKIAKRNIKNNRETYLLSGLDSFVFIDTIFEKAFIYTPGIVIDSNVHVGMAKDSFLKKFRLKSVSDSQIIGESTWGCVFTFYFDKDSLREIKYELKYIDFD